MSDLLLNSDDDLDFSSGGLQLTTGITKTIQNARIRLRFFKDSWFLDPTQGIPYIQSIFKKGTSLSTIEIIFRDALRQIPEVVNIDALAVEYNENTRALAVTFTLQTTDGPVSFGELLINV